MQGVSWRCGDTITTTSGRTHHSATKHPLKRAERLGLERIRRLQLSDALVVLSACRTGVGELVPGEGVVGLARSFMEAGAAGIVVTHWPVDDAAAARLMVEFHRQLADGRSPATALAVARRSRRAEGDLPRDWAPFEIVLRPSS